MDDPVQDATLAGIGANGPPTFIPVDHDPFAIQSMTHWPEAPNPVAGIVKRGTDFLTSGDVNPVHLPGTKPEDYLRELAQNPDILAKNIEQASNFNFGGITLTSAMKAALASGRSYSDVGKEFGLTRGQIASALYRDRQIEAGVARPRSERPDYFWEQNPHLAAQAKQLSDEGVSLGEIAKRLNVTRGAVAGRLWRGQGAPPPETTSAISSQWVTLPDGTLQRLTGDPEAIKRLRPVEHDPFSVEPERITHAAIRTKTTSGEDKLYLGYSHLNAMDKIGAGGEYGGAPMEDGFVTSTGRFVDRGEAAKIHAGGTGSLTSGDVPVIKAQRPPITDKDREELLRAWDDIVKGK